VFLYRGETEAFHQNNGYRLKPKLQGPFEAGFHWDEPDLQWDSGATWDTSEANAVLRHELKQKGFPTSGISTTPDFERAVVYARGKDGRSPGLVAKIDASLLAAHGVRQLVVANVARSPSVPSDAEVILVTKDGAPLPEEVIVERIPITPPASEPEE
jgi:hypothetical protein